MFITRTAGSRASLYAAALLAFVISAGCSKTSSAQIAVSGNSVSTPSVNVTSRRQVFNSLPTRTDGTAPSADRRTMDALMARAANENKSIVLEVSAAWCGPCTNFAYDIDSHPSDLTELSSNGYILVKAESERIVNGGGLDLIDLTDYLPAMIKFFPSFYVYTAKDGWKGLGPQSNYDSLKKALDAQAPVPLDSVADIKAYIEKPGNETDTDGGNRMNAALMGNVIGTYSYADAKAIVQLLKDEDGKYPGKGYASMADFVTSFLSGYYGIGLVDLKTLTQDFPDVAHSINDASNDSFSPIPFYYQLASVLRTGGPKQAVQQCPALWTTYRAQIVAGKLSAADFQKKMANLDVTVQLNCADLELQAYGASTTLKAKVDKIDKTKNKDWKLLAGLGDVQGAIDIYKAHYKPFADFYAKNLAALNKDLQTAQSQNDKSKVDEDLNRIDLNTFQTKYHASVDSEVETNLRANQPVQSLHVYN